MMQSGTKRKAKRADPKTELAPALPARQLGAIRSAAGRPKPGAEARPRRSRRPQGAPAPAGGPAATRIARASRAQRAARRESGLPGGGAGRRDEVGHSGVYPMSGPHPAGPAELRSAAAWGQGSRGARGYEDSGRSSLVFSQGELLGGLDTGAPGSPPAPALAVPEAGWTKLLDEFSRQHKGCWVTVEVITGLGAELQARGVPLLGVGAEIRDGRAKAYVQLGDEHRDVLTHIVNAPIAVRLRPPGELEIDDANNVRTLIRCIGHRPSLVR